MGQGAQGGSSLSPEGVLPAAANTGTCMAGLYEQDLHLSCLHNDSCPLQRSATFRQMRKRTQETPLAFAFECPRWPGHSLRFAFLVPLYLIGPSRGPVQRGMAARRNSSLTSRESRVQMCKRSVSVRPCRSHSPFPAPHLCCPPLLLPLLPSSHPPQMGWETKGLGILLIFTPVSSSCSFLLLFKQ